MGALIPGMGGMVMGNVVSTLLVLPFPFLISGNNLLKVTQDVNLLAIGCVMGLLASALPALGEVSSLRLLPAHIYSVVLSLEPAIAAAVGIVMLGEATGLVRWAAIALLVAAVSAFQFLTLVRRRRRRRRVPRIPIDTCPVRWMHTQWILHRWQPVPLHSHQPARLRLTVRQRALTC